MGYSIGHLQYPYAPAFSSLRIYCASSTSQSVIRWACAHTSAFYLTFSRQPWSQKLPRSDVWAPYLTQVPTLSSVRFAARFVRWGNCWKHWTIIGPFKTRKSLLKLLCLQFRYILVPSCPDPSLWPQPGKILHFSAFRFGSPGHV